jgi:hypothetical protein
MSVAVTSFEEEDNGKDSEYQRGSRSVSVITSCTGTGMSYITQGCQDRSLDDGRR